jgi:hypothetical protein
VIQPVGERSWEDVNYNGQGHRTCVNMELVMFFQLLYLDMVHVGAQRVATCSWTHWVLRKYADQGSFQDAVVKMF